MVLDADPLNTVVIPLTATGQGGAATPGDYSGIPASMTFNSGETEKSFTISAADDSIDDDGESVEIAIGTPLPNIIKKGLTGETTVSITDNDTAGVTITPTGLTVTEGQTATYTVVLDSQPTGDVTVTVKDPTDNTDVTADPATLTFTANTWDEAQEVTVSAAQDDDDQDESATVTHEAASTGDANYDGITAPDVGVTLEDDAPENLTVSFKESSYDAGEGSTALVALTLDLDPERTVTVPLTHAGQNGAGANDYSGVPANVVFNSGDTEKTFTFSATDDAVDDDDESVLIGFGTLPADVTAGTTPSEATVSINDDDDPSVTISFEQASYTVDRGQFTVTVKVKLSADPERSVTIPLTHAGQGGAGNSDYSGVPANVAFNPGETEKTFSFSATADDVDDDDESVKLGFGNVLPAGVSTGTTNESIVSITDDDVPAVTVSFEQASYTVPEGSGVSIKVKLDTDPERSVTIPISNTNQSGASSADYSGVPSDVTIGAGDTEAMFTFAATQDTYNDDGESVKLAFGQNLPGGVSEGGTNETVVSITDDDLPSVSVSFEQANYTVLEGEDVTVTVTLSADPERTVTIPLSKSNQGGASNSDYSGVPASVTFNSEDTEAMFTLSATAESDNDDGESVKLGFGNLPTGISAGSTDETTVSITDDDVPQLTVQLPVSTRSVPEGGNTYITLNLSGNPEREVTIPLTATHQGGASNSDYTMPESVTFDAEENTKLFYFTANQDQEDDDGESVQIGIGTPLPEGITIGTFSTTTVSINDNDDPQVQVSFAQGTYAAAEGGTVEVTVTLDNDPERTVEIPITATGQGGASSGDYSGVPGNVTFNSGETEKSFTFSATQDTEDDDGESVKLTFGSTLPDRVSAGTTNETTVSITDDDVPQIAVSFEQSTYSVAEGSSATVKVKLSEDPERTVTIPITRANQGGASNSRLLRRTGEPHLQRWRYRADDHLRRGRRQRQRRRGVGEAGLWQLPSRRRVRGQHR